jgi:hypothetical protein
MGIGAGAVSADSERGQSVEEIDRECAADLAGDDCREARAWCRDPKSMGFELSASEMLEIAESFYTAGATAVHVTGISELGGRNISASMVVTMPSDAAARKRVLAAHAEFAQRADITPAKEEGQKYLPLGLD